MRKLFQFFGIKIGGGTNVEKTNLLLVQDYTFDNKHRMLEDAYQHQLVKVDERIRLIEACGKASLKDMVQSELRLIAKKRTEFLLRVEEIANSDQKTWNKAKLNGKRANDALLSSLATAERKFGLPVGEG
jgi:hypothetical protein